MNNKHINSLVIVGGGTAGWMTAASLARHFQNTPLKIHLVESSRIGTVGVGEATIPSIRRSYRALGMTDNDVIQSTNATCKLAIRFDGWAGKSSSFYHPFGLFGQDVNQVAFHHYWLKLQQQGHPSDLGQYSLAVALAKNNKFLLPAPAPKSPISIFDWALHFDAALFAQHMKTSALDAGVQHTDGMIEKVHLRPSDGFIESVELDSGLKIHGDLFIDCSGFQGILIEGALKTGYESWSELLKCDRAIAIQSDLDDVADIPPFTKSIAHSAGWQWKIPLRTRQGNGYVYSSRHISDDEALKTLNEHIVGRATTEPNVIPFNPGRRLKAWNKNCIALGLAAGFLEPLESTSIALIETGIEKIKLLFPDKLFRQSVIDEFNEMTSLEYERVRDFIILHYKLNARTGEAFWDECRAAKIPEPLKHKLELFKQRGHLAKYRWEIFQNPSWLAMYNGFGFLPDTYDLAADNFSVEYLKNAFMDMQNSIDKAVNEAPSHREFLAQFS